MQVISAVMKDESRHLSGEGMKRNVIPLHFLNLIILNLRGTAFSLLLINDINVSHASICVQII